MTWCNLKNVPCIYPGPDDLENCRYCEYYNFRKAIEYKKKHNADRVYRVEEKKAPVKNNSDYALWILIIFVIVLALLLLGCGRERNSVQSRIERDHLYWKDVECEIEDSWFNTAVPALCSGWVRVRLDEYGLEETFDLQGFEASEMRTYVRHNKTITCEMYSWVLDSTGEVTRRMLNKITE